MLNFVTESKETCKELYINFESKPKLTYRDRLFKVDWRQILRWRINLILLYFTY